LLFAAVAAAASVVISVTYVVIDTDFWQHLAVGRAIWELGRVPTTQLWTWPTYGTPDVNASWGFRVLLWPLWSTFDVWGLYGWRWATTLAAFALAWATARRIGARGFIPLVVIALAALVYRQRSQPRPETLVAVLLALEIWILEWRRHRAPDARGIDPAWALVPVAWAWANTHLSYWMGLALIAIHLAGALMARRRTGGLARAGIAAVAISFVNPFGWRALWQPFQYFLEWRHEPIYQTVGELLPVQWEANWQNGLPLLVAGWPLLWIWRAARGRVDRIEAMTLVLFTALGLSTQRFLGLYALVATPYVARDLGEWLTARRGPKWIRPPWTRAAVAVALVLSIGIPEWSRPELPFGVGIDPLERPERTADAMIAWGVAGRGFNTFAIGGYQVYRFWPEHQRLPFMDIHQAGTPEIRARYIAALAGPEGWQSLDRRFHFDYVLLSRRAASAGALPDALDADTSFVPILVDDAAALLVRSEGRHAALAAREGYRTVPLGPSRRRALRAAAIQDTALRARAAAELDRMIASSPWSGSAHDLRGELAAFADRFDEARDHLALAVAQDPLAVGPNERLGVLELIRGDPRAALAAFERERRVRGRDGGGLDLRFGQAWRQLGRLDRARAAYRRELERGPWSREATDSLAALDRIGG